MRDCLPGVTYSTIFRCTWRSHSKSKLEPFHVQRLRAAGCGVSYLGAVAASQEHLDFRQEDGDLKLNPQVLCSGLRAAGCGVACLGGIPDTLGFHAGIQGLKIKPASFRGQHALGDHLQFLQHKQGPGLSLSLYRAAA